jgi:hypothetical protein
MATAALKTEAPGRKIRLPEPCSHGAISLEQALCARRSVRDFTREALELAQIG